MQENLQKAIDRLYKTFSDYKIEDFQNIGCIDWTHDEKASLNDFMTALIEKRLSIDIDIGLLIECALTLNFDLESITSNWKSNENLYRDQIVSLLDYFDYTESSKSLPVGHHFRDCEKIKVFLDSLLVQLTKNEINEIYDITFN